MATIHFIEHNGTEHTVETQVGLSVMETAIKRNVPGIDADCGGATCHVYVDDTWLPALEVQSEMEASMLDFAEGVEANSRLSCQIRITDALDGLTVRMPENQH